jgi:hypothetical protein
LGKGKEHVMGRWNVAAALAGVLLAAGCTQRSPLDQQGAPPPARHPDVANRAAADQEASHSFAEDDPRVASGLARNKEAYEDQTSDEAPLAAPRQ